MNANKFLKTRVPILVFFLLVSGDILCQQELNVYGNIDPTDYLQGKFNPHSHPCFVSLNSRGIPTDGRQHFLREETAKALEIMYYAMKKQHPELKFWVQSSTRNWSYQKAIWEKKWTGKSLVGGRKLNQMNKDHIQRARKILEYSSMPGTSRHHWGTDFDINVLRNSYYKKGDGRKLFNWLRKYSKKFDFCQPYTAGRKAGYKEERWHWSYRPLASVFLADWNRLVKSNTNTIAARNKFNGSRKVFKLAPIYVNSINEQCK